MSAAKCPHGDESFVVADYLAGRLSEADASAFEEHAFGCDRCIAELERATELRAALDADNVRTRGERPRSMPWPAFALAAALVLGVGLWMARPLLAPEPAYRAGDDAAPTLDLAVTRIGERIALSWEPVPGADLYEVRVFTAAGDPVHAQRSEKTSMQLFPADWQEDAAADRLHVQVIAFDELRQAIARSELETLKLGGGS